MKQKKERKIKFRKEIIEEFLSGNFLADNRVCLNKEDVEWIKNKLEEDGNYKLIEVWEAGGK